MFDDASEPKFDAPIATGIEYRAIQDLPGYRVGSDGTIWSLRRGTEWRRMKTQIHPNGYEGVGLMHQSSGKQRRCLVHNLVLVAFAGPRPSKMQACHCNGKRVDNRAENLRWDTWHGNFGDRAVHGTEVRGESVSSSKLKASDVAEMRRLYATGVGCHRLGKQFGVSTNAAWRVTTRQTWKHVA